MKLIKTVTIYNCDRHKHTCSNAESKAHLYPDAYLPRLMRVIQTFSNINILDVAHKAQQVERASRKRLFEI